MQRDRGVELRRPGDRLLGDPSDRREVENIEYPRDDQGDPTANGGRAAAAI